MNPNADVTCRSSVCPFRLPEGHLIGDHPLLEGQEPPSQSPYEASRAVFDSYCAMDEPELPETITSALQVRLYRWRIEQFGLTGDNTMGVVEELGELAEAFLSLTVGAGKLAHMRLKSLQNIRGFGDRNVARKAAADAIADILVFLTQLATDMRLDLWTIYRMTAEEVMQRDFKADPVTGGIS